MHVVTIRSCVRCITLVAVLIGCAASVRAQIAGPAITGAIADAAGEPVPGATVTVTNQATNQPRIAVTTADGVYAVPGLLPGQYRLEITVPGFKTIRHSGIRLATGQKARLDFTVTVGDVREDVTVTS